MTKCQFHQRFMAAFTLINHEKPKKIQISHQYLFTLSGSVGAKAVRRSLMKLSLGYHKKMRTNSLYRYFYQGWVMIQTALSGQNIIFQEIFTVISNLNKNY